MTVTPHAVGTAAAVAGAFDLPVAWPAGHVDGTVGVLWVNSPNESNALRTANGFVQFAEVSGGAVHSFTGQRTTGYWCRADAATMAANGGVMPSPVVAFDPSQSGGNSFHLAVIDTFNGCVRTGSPINAFGGDAGTVASTAVTIPGGTTTVPKCLIALCLADTRDNAGSNFGGGPFVNASLASVSSLADSNTALGNGGGLYRGYGRKNAAGTFSATTATLGVSSTQGRLWVALAPETPIRSLVPHGRLEGRITVPTGGYSGTVDGVSWTVPAGEYFLSTPATAGSSLLAALQAAIDGATAATIAVTVSADEIGDGFVTITSSSAVAIAWSSTVLRDLLGFTTDLTSAMEWTGARQARALWLPDCSYKALGGGLWRGWRVSDFTATETPAGHAAAFQSQSHQASQLTWPAVRRALLWQAFETTVNASWERFARDCIWGNAPWGTAGGPIRFHPNADSDAVFCTYWVPDLAEIDPPSVQDRWALGPGAVALPRLIVAPTYAAYGA